MQINIVRTRKVNSKPTKYNWPISVSYIEVVNPQKEKNHPTAKQALVVRIV